MIYTTTDEWIPSPKITLPDTALDIVKSDNSISILAGPGAGKTELLAQRANFLLTTGQCPPPRRILALAFKTDAARNLKERVAERCEPIHSQRFESLTLSAFAKRILDQFREALPDELRPSPDYTIFSLNRGIWESFVQKHADELPILRQKNLDFAKKITPIFFPNCKPKDKFKKSQKKIQKLWWQEQLDNNPSTLTFDMVMFLAIYIIKHNNVILSALQQTYSHVFLDEFQDVTNLQYHLIKVAFHKSETVMTAVGDSNQAIMAWAGALPDIFTLFEKDFNTTTQKILFNYRSNQKIVDLINNLSATFDDNHVDTECFRNDDPSPDDAIEVWIYDTRKNEGDDIAQYISDKLQNDPTLSPEDFVILARLRVDDVEDRMSESFTKNNLKIRNEARLVGGTAIQDLVKDTLYSFLLSCLKLSTNVRTGQPFQHCINVISDLRGLDISTEKGHCEAISAIRLLTSELQELTKNKTPSKIDGSDIKNKILDHFDLKEFQKIYSDYNSNELLNSIVLGFTAFFDECSEGIKSWSECISNMEGVGSVRLMTIHKAKGLEYHTVIFTEFNDDAFWGNEDDVNVFFVALSRARKQIKFCFTKDSRGLSNIDNLYNQLEAAEIPFVEKNNS